MGTWVVQGVRAQGLGVVGDRLAYGKRGVRRRSPGPGVRGWAGIQSGTWAREHGGEAADKGGASRPKPPFPVQLLGALVPPRPHLPKVLLPAEPDSLSMRWAWASGRCSAGPNACRAVPHVCIPGKWEDKVRDLPPRIPVMMGDKDGFLPLQHFTG